MAGKVLDQERYPHRSGYTSQQCRPLTKSSYLPNPSLLSSHVPTDQLPQPRHNSSYQNHKLLLSYYKPKNPTTKTEPKAIYQAVLTGKNPTPMTPPSSHQPDLTISPSSLIITRRRRHFHQNYQEPLVDICWFCHLNPFRADKSSDPLC